jgi:hypothetical protein
VKVANLFYDWMLSAPGYLQDRISDAEKGVDGFFKHLEDRVTLAFGAAADEMKKNGTKFGDLGPPPPAPSPHAVRHHGPGSLLGANGPTNPDNTHANWLLEKLKSFLTGTPDMTDLDLDLISDLTSLKDQISSQGTAVLADLKTFWAGIVTSIEHPKDFLNQGVDDILDGLAGAIKTGLIFLDDVVDAILKIVSEMLSSIKAVLSASFADIPLIGPMLKAAGMESASLGQLVSLIAAFPFTLAWKIDHGSDAVPLQQLMPPAQTRGHAPHGRVPGLLGATNSPTDIPNALNMGAAITTLTWAALDTVEAPINAFSPSLKGYGDIVALLLAGCDIGFPVIIAGLTFPATGPDHIPYHSSPVTADKTSVLTFLAWGTGFLGVAFAGYNMYKTVKLAEDWEIFRTEAADIGFMLNFLAGGVALIAGMVAAVETPGWSAANIGIAVTNSAGAMSDLLQTTPARSFLVKDLSVLISMVVILSSGSATAGLLIGNPPDGDTPALLPIGGQVA